MQLLSFFSHIHAFASFHSAGSSLLKVVYTPKESETTDRKVSTNSKVQITPLIVAAQSLLSESTSFFLPSLSPQDLRELRLKTFDSSELDKAIDFIREQSCNLTNTAKEEKNKEPQIATTGLDSQQLIQQVESGLNIRQVLVLLVSCVSSRSLSVYMLMSHFKCKFYFPFPGFT